MCYLNQLTIYILHTFTSNEFAFKSLEKYKKSRCQIGPRTMNNTNNETQSVNPECASLLEWPF